jgi:hypothetical protein
MSEKFWRVWAFIRHILSVRGLLDWLGWKQSVGAVIIGLGTGFWSWITGMPGPVVFALAMGVIAATVIVWRGIAIAMQPEPSSCLRFGERNHVDIGPGIGYEASLVSKTAFSLNDSAG